jgi:hypothetical protein
VRYRPQRTPKGRLKNRSTSNRSSRSTPRFGTLIEDTSTEAGINLAVVNEVEKEEVSGQQRLPREAKDGKIGDVELPFSILPKTPGSYLIQNIDLDNLEREHDD